MIKFSNRNLIIVHIATFLIFSIYFIITVKDCTAYFMHDASMEVSLKKSILNTFLLIILPCVILAFREFIRIKDSLKLLVFNYVLSLTSISLISVAFNKPCNFVNGGNYMFINFFTISFSYLLKFASHFLLLIILITTIVTYIKNTKKI